MARIERGRTVVTDAKTIELLASPARQELIDGLEARGGEASVVELSSDLGRRADGLYYHLRLLVRGGLVEELPGRSAAGREERRYRLTRPAGAPLRLGYRAAEAGAPAKAKKRRHAGAVKSAVDSMLRIAGRDFAAALADESTVTDGAERELWASRMRGWLSADELAEANRLLTRLNTLLIGPRRDGQDRLFSVCFVLAKLGGEAEG